MQHTGLKAWLSANLSSAGINQNHAFGLLLSHAAAFSAMRYVTLQASHSIASTAGPMSQQTGTITLFMGCRCNDTCTAWKHIVRHCVGSTCSSGLASFCPFVLPGTLLLPTVASASLGRSFWGKAWMSFVLSLTLSGSPTSSPVCLTTAHCVSCQAHGHVEVPLRCLGCKP